MTRRLGPALTAVSLALGGCGAGSEPGLWNQITFVSGDRRIENFRELDRIFPGRPVHRSDTVSELPRSLDPRDVTYAYAGSERRLSELLERTVATGIVVLHDGRVVQEAYWHGASEASRFTTWSVAKSFVSALVGVAVAHGLVAGIDRPVSEYVPELRGGGYDGVAIEDVLSMTSGVRFREEYGAGFSDIRRLFYRMFFLHGRVDPWVATRPAESPPGSRFRYKSVDTQVLGMLLERVTGESNAEWLERTLWRPLGMESDASWSLDAPGDTGRELAFCCVNATLRDWARFGLLYANGGAWNGRQIVPAAWVVASTAPARPSLEAGSIPGTSLGYGHHWWIPPGGRGDFVAIGVYGQYLYVSPADRVVVALAGADTDYAFPDDEHLAALRALAATYAGGPSAAPPNAANTAGSP